LRFGRFWLDLDLWLRGWIALQRLILAAIVLVGHAMLRHVVALLFSGEFSFIGIQKLIGVAEGVAVFSLMAALLLEAVRIFLPPPIGIKLDLR